MQCLENVYIYHILDPICTSDISTRSLLQQKIGNSTNKYRVPLSGEAKLEGQQWCRVTFTIINSLSFTLCRHMLVRVFLHCMNYFILHKIINLVKE